MSAKTKRPWFRFHLLTAVLMMLSAGGVLWANTNVHAFPVYLGEDITKHIAGRGWPLRYLETNKGAEELGCSIMVREDREGCMDYPPLLFDCICGVGILAVVAFLSESILRRREARKT